MKYIKRIVTHSSIYFTLIILLFSIIAQIYNNSSETEANLGLAPSVCGIFFLFSAFCAAADLIFYAEKKIGYLFCLALHFITDIAGFVISFTLYGKGAENLTRNLFVGLILFVVVYALCALVFSLIRGKKKRKSNEQEDYESIYSVEKKK